MSDNIKPQEPLKTLRAKGLAIVTKGERTGRFVRLIQESSYAQGKIIWAVEYHVKKHGDDLDPRFNEDILMCIAHQFEPAILPENGDECIFITDNLWPPDVCIVELSVERTAEIILEGHEDYKEPGNE